MSKSPAVTPDGTPFPVLPARLGAYELVEVLGRGGMGVVYRARHPRLQREVALKLLLAGERATPLQRERFLREAQAAARVRHPHVVAVLDAGEEQGRPFIVLELVQGESLAARLARAGPLAPREAAQVARALALGLHAAHEHALLHRDVKPANVFLEHETGRPLLGDFGLVKVVDAGDDDLTRSGQPIGTPTYMSPEQATGELLDWRSDVWAVGATLYESLTGRPPFEAGSAIELLARVVSAEPADPRRLRPQLVGQKAGDLVNICLLCLEKRRERRYPTALALAEDLDRWLRGEPTAARPPGPLERARKWARRNPGAARAVGGAIAVAAVALLASGLSIARERTAAREQARDELLDRARRSADEALAELAASAAPTSSGSPLRPALRALLAAQRWHGLAEGEDSARAQHRATLSLARAAIASEQWDLAGLACEEARLLAVDAAEVAALALELERARTSEERRRAEAIDALLRRALAQDLPRLDEAVLAIVRWPEPASVRRLVAALDQLGARLERKEPLGKGEEDQLRVVCQALGWIGIAEGAVPALERYLAAEQDQVRAVSAGLALCRLKAPTAVLAARERFGTDGPFARQLAHELPLASAVKDPRLKSALERHARGDLAGARAELDRLIGSDPTNVAALVDRGLVLQGQGDLRGALADFERAVALEPRAASAWFNRGNARQALGDDQGALADYDRAIALDPRGVEVWNNRGLVKQRLGDEVGAIADFTRGLELDPTSAILLGSRGSFRMDTGDLDGAIADFTRAIELDARSASPYANRGKARLRRGDHAGAIADCTRAIELDPEAALAWGFRGSAHHARGDLTRAIADFTRHLELDPANADAWNARGNSRFYAGDLAGAIADCTRAIELDPGSAQAWNNRGNARAAGDPAGAIADYSRAIELVPGDAPAWSNRGNARLLTGDVERSIADCTRATELDPKYAAGWFNRGNAHLRKGDLPRALADYGRAIEVDPRDPGPRANRAIARQSSGDIAGAIVDLERFLELAPRHEKAPLVREALEQLRQKR